MEEKVMDINKMIKTTVTEVKVIKIQNAVDCKLHKIEDKDGILVYDIDIKSNGEPILEPILLEWKIPAINVKGVWKPTTDFAKRIQADWELDHMESRISIDAPVINLFGHDDVNILTFACSDAIHKLEMNARIREEDNFYYCHISFFTEQDNVPEYFKTQLRLDFNTYHFSDALRNVSSWWESFVELKPTHVPQIAKTPLYSTWYQFHQNLNEDVLIKECELAYDLGYKAIIIDDGWQTKDSNRGYDFTGDWQPDRIPKMKEFIAKIHATGMKIGLWYSVPFCGKNSKAYQKFKGKFLTENHRWAPVFDPRYPEVRAYLVNTYVNALREWNLDGFKLDFIDDFRLYPDTPLNKENGRDFASINEAVDCLMTDVTTSLQEINTDVFIEFRQKYTGPAMRKYGNMFRAFDCPGDATMNRVRIADIKMLCGNSAVHSDMVTWHKDEPVHIAALQVVNTLFGVPQLSILLQEAEPAHINMIRFYTQYWNKYSEVLLRGSFIPSRPLSNYPTKTVANNTHFILGVYEDFVASLDTNKNHIHIINGKVTEDIIIKIFKDMGTYECATYDCEGKMVSKKCIDFNSGILQIKIPACGLLMSTRK